MNKTFVESHNGKQTHTAVAAAAKNNERIMIITNWLVGCG